MVKTANFENGRFFWDGHFTLMEFFLKGKSVRAACCMGTSRGASAFRNGFHQRRPRQLVPWASSIAHLCPGPALPECATAQPSAGTARGQERGQSLTCSPRALTPALPAGDRGQQGLPSSQRSALPRAPVQAPRRPLTFLRKSLCSFLWGNLIILHAQEPGAGPAGCPGHCPSCCRRGGLPCSSARPPPGASAGSSTRSLPRGPRHPAVGCSRGAWPAPK